MLSKLSVIFDRPAVLSNARRCLRPLPRSSKKISLFSNRHLSKFNQIKNVADVIGSLLLRLVGLK